MAVLLISETKLKENSFINENVDDKLIRATIIQVQDMQIHPILGTGLYNEIKSQITSNNVSAANVTLLQDYIQPVIIWWVQADGTIPLTYKIMNKSIVKRNSENSNPAELDELFAIADNFKNKAEFYTKRLVKFLQANTDTYPLYLNPGNDVDTLHPYRQAYQTGMNLDIDTYKPTSMQTNSQFDCDNRCEDIYTYLL
jgi:hypothetical protein